MTTDGLFGADLPLQLGLNILSAPNTTGKSTVLQSIIYALGLERMLSPKREIPLPYAMQDRVRIDGDKPGPSIVESWVSVELQNQSGDVLTAKRWVKGDQDYRLVSTWNGPTLTDPSSTAEQRDYFVRDPGAARRESGFHTFFADFLGWNLPDVQTFDGGLVPLYLETIFPLLFVEQKAGWSTIRGPFPTYLRIRDVGRRAIEFLLDLDAQRVRVARRELEDRLTEQSQKWRDAQEELSRTTGAAVTRVQGIPVKPTAEFATSPRYATQVFRKGDWVALDEVLRDDRTKLSELQEQGVPTTGEESAALARDLNVIRDEVDALTAEREVLLTELRRENGEAISVRKRIETLEIDLHRNKDALKLRGFGSLLGATVDSGTCPTCHQGVDYELLPPGGGPAMGLEENVEFITSQLNLYRSMLGSIERREEELDRQRLARNQEIHALRTRIRAIRSTLVAPDSAPSEASIRERLELESRIESYEKLEQTVSELVQRLVDAASDYVDLKSEQARLPKSDFSKGDSRKLDRIERVIRDQLTAYGFSTYAPEDVHLSRESFEPYVTIRSEEIEADAELGFQMSASDAVRMKWAYLLSMLALADGVNSNHPGFLILDEPRQQETERLSFDALIGHSVECTGSERQVLLATSETPEELSGAIEGLAVNVLRREGLLLQPITH